jgi:glycosyltransferase involved in cell wall biosynthesis
MPFFTPMWARIPAFMLIFQLAREVWWYESPFPLSAVGYLCEPFYLMGYRHTPVFTISESTAQDLRRLGFRGPITLISIGVQQVSTEIRPKPRDPRFLYVGRLAPSKRVAHVLRAFARFQSVRGTGSLTLLGGGSRRYRESLARLAKRLHIERNVIFSGWVPTPEKYRLMGEAHALLMTSVREGWGLVVTEANSCGTPAVVYDVPGLRDSVRHNSTGLVVPPRPDRLADAMIRLMSDSSLYDRLATEALRWSRTLSFDEAAKVVITTLEQQLVA